MLSAESIESIPPTQSSMDMSLWQPAAAPTATLQDATNGDWSRTGGCLVGGIKSGKPRRVSFGAAQIILITPRQTQDITETIDSVHAEMGCVESQQQPQSIIDNAIISAPADAHPFTSSDLHHHAQVDSSSNNLAADFASNLLPVVRQHLEESQYADDATSFADDVAAVIESSAAYDVAVPLVTDATSCTSDDFQGSDPDCSTADSVGAIVSPTPPPCEDPPSRLYFSSLAPAASNLLEPLSSSSSSLFASLRYANDAPPTQEVEHSSTTAPGDPHIDTKTHAFQQGHPSAELNSPPSPLVPLCSLPNDASRLRCSTTTLISDEAETVCLSHTSPRTPVARELWKEASGAATHATAVCPTQRLETSDTSPSVLPFSRHKADLNGGIATPSCVFCGLRDASVVLHSGYYLHVPCALWCPEVYCDPMSQLLKHVSDAVDRARHIKCAACRGTGATVGCVEPSCQRSYHLPCALDAGCEVRPTMVPCDRSPASASRARAIPATSAVGSSSTTLSDSSFSIRCPACSAKLHEKETSGGKRKRSRSVDGCTA